MYSIKVFPTDKRLKQLIKEFGDEWELLRIKENVQCFHGTGFYIQSLCGKHSRWIEKESFKNL